VVKFSSIPLPEPLYEITVSHPDGRHRRVLVHALCFLLRGTPALGVEALMIVHNHSGGGLLTALLAAYLTLAVAVLLVGVRDDGGEDA
jgi:hypothetical protein